MLPFFLVSALSTWVAVASLAPGDAAPLFHATDTDGTVHDLGKLCAAGPVLLVFYPRAFTGTCTRELTAYGASHADFAAIGAQILAISADEPDAARQFRLELKAPYPFIADVEGRIIRLYDVKTFLLTMAKRVTFVIDRQCRIGQIMAGDAAVDIVGALAAARALARDVAPTGAAPPHRTEAPAGAPAATKTGRPASAVP